MYGSTLKQRGQAKTSYGHGSNHLLMLDTEQTSPF
jgi:hypothetical protein